ncbi:pyridoxamine 5'-phosphate oxidase family protein [Tenggerimyces flavus]|uniref:Pyridoxamine 5'-phosphate oxidase family protein n=1 Tax=Tenggerimyces flavus TaxID=1708749 RepID=A0ABV7YFM3_9ACTN|nr:pyridoxamine 5'-phosphate oxidase family protein [Tenggerimyces flavus]MBM7786029.1 hypothetical protein [Tenggerimyces flavus]
MVEWHDFVEEAPHIAELFQRRHQATGNLCMLGTLRSDGYPRISPVEPRIFEGHLTIMGMPGTTKFADLERDPRFTLHTATVDTHVSEGDAKLTGDVVNLQDEELHQRFTQALFEEIGMDLRGQRFDPFFVADLKGASTVEMNDGVMYIRVWKPGQGERAVRKT